MSKISFALLIYSMIIDGKKLAEELTVDLKKQFKKFKKIILAAIIIGNEPASLSFLKQKSRLGKILGIELKIYKLPAGVSEKRLIEEVKKLGRNKKIAGIIIQLPLAKRFNLEKILKALPANKDIDALSPKSLVFAPAIEVIKFIFKKYRIKPKNKKIVLIGLGRLVGKPIYFWLKSQKLSQNIFVIEENISADKRTDLIKRADILISGVGKANLISENLVKKGAIVIDFGYSFKKGKIYGDINKKAAVKARLFTPTPGGTGPLLVVMLFQNLFSLLKRG